MTTTTECIFVAADVYLHLDDEEKGSRIIRAHSAALPKTATDPYVIATVVSTDGRYVVEDAKVTPSTGAMLQFEWQFQRAPDGPYISSIVDSPHQLVEDQIQKVLRQIGKTSGTPRSPTRKLLHALINLSFIQGVDQHRQLMPTLSQLAWCLNIDKLLAAPRDPGCSLFLLAALVRAHLPTEAP